MLIPMKQKLLLPMAGVALLFAVTAVARLGSGLGEKNIGVAAKPMADAEVIIDGTRETLDAKWIYWMGMADLKPGPSQ